MNLIRSAKLVAVTAASALLLGCAGGRGPQRCHNLVQNSTFENGASGWLLPPFARPAPAGAGGVAAVVVGEGPAEGAVAQTIARSRDLSSIGVIAVGYARVESAGVAPTDADATASLWSGTVNVVNAYSKNERDFLGPYARLSFTGREIASGCWKRFVTEVIPAANGKLLYPHFAFWGARLSPGVKLHLTGLALVEAPVEPNGDPELWLECPSLPVPKPSLESPTRRQWSLSLAPNGDFQNAFEMAVQAVPGEPRRRELRLRARYRQGSFKADRFVVAVTEDGSDPRLSPTSQVVTILARQGVEQWETAVRVGADARPLAVAVAAAAATREGLRPQTPVIPAAWQRGRL